MSISSLPPGTAEAIDKFAAAQKAMEEAVTASAAARMELINLLCPYGDLEICYRIVRNGVIYTIKRPSSYSNSNTSPTVEYAPAVAL